MNFVVVGAGAWGTAFALHVVRAGHRATLVPRRPDQTQDLTARRENMDYLPGVHLPAELAISSNLDAAMRDAEIVMLACPAQALRTTGARVKSALPEKSRVKLLVSLAKGLELGTHRRPSEVMAEVLPGLQVGSLTGPTNALEVAREHPSAMVLATTRAEAGAAEMQAAISGPKLRVYTSDDLAGVEFGGCLKNIYAIAAGCCDGLKFGDNTKAALVTRALREMVRVGTGLGAKPETFYGLSGFGDLVATCYGGWSRNREFGQRIGEGKTVAELIAHRKTVVEGYKTTEAFTSLCAARGLDAPIMREVHAILAEGKKPAMALRDLMTRELKAENPRG
jgi:glycerol-3-phosphate dehydrogenase (NAD(P)+)